MQITNLSPRAEEDFKAVLTKAVEEAGGLDTQSPLWKGYWEWYALNFLMKNKTHVEKEFMHQTELLRQEGDVAVLEFSKYFAFVPRGMEDSISQTDAIANHPHHRFSIELRIRITELNKVALDLMRN